MEVGEIAEFTLGKSFRHYQQDGMMRAAVERPFEIIGEALNQLLQQEPRLASEISNAPRIIAFRNRLIHGYASISSEIVWGVVETGLPVLIEETERLPG